MWVTMNKRSPTRGLTKNQTLFQLWQKKILLKYCQNKCENIMNTSAIESIIMTISAVIRSAISDGTQKILEEFYIALMRPNLNGQCDSSVLTLFRNGIT